MAEVRTPRTVKIKVPAVYLWAAGQKAQEQGLKGDAARVRTIFKNNLSRLKASSNFYRKPLESNFRVAVKELLGKGVIPFVRSELDLLFAAFVFGEGGEFVLRSEKSRVACGFLRATGVEITYVDRIKDMMRMDSELEELLSVSDKRRLIQTFEDLSVNTVSYHSSSDDSIVLTVRGVPGLLSVFGDGAVKCQISTWGTSNIGDTSGRATKLHRSLGDAELLLKDDCLCLSGVSAQTRLELTAASLVGRLLMIESDNFRSLGVLPDLTSDSDCRKVSIDSMRLVRGLTLGKAPTVSVAPLDVHYFSKMFAWFVPEDASFWWETNSL